MASFEAGGKCTCGADVLHWPGVGPFCVRTGVDAPCDSPKDATVTAQPLPKADWWIAFHHLWTKAVGTPDYVKAEWMRLESLLLQAKER